MLSKHLLQPDFVPPTFSDRRRDVLTRAVVTGLQKLNEHIEQLPSAPDRAAALAAVACFDQRIADALESVNAETGAGPR